MSDRDLITLMLAALQASWPAVWSEKIHADAIKAAKSRLSQKG